MTKFQTLKHQYFFNSIRLDGIYKESIAELQKILLSKVFKLDFSSRSDVENEYSPIFLTVEGIVMHFILVP